MENAQCELIPTNVSNLVKEGSIPCPTYISITPSRAEKLDYIIFQNYYVSSISILQQNRDGKFVTILSDFRLTNFPHFENDSENWYIISSSFFNDNFISSYFKEIRIYLIQPSPNWKEFALRNVSCYTIKEKAVAMVNEPVSAFSKLRAQISKNVEVLSNAVGSDIVSYEDTLNGVVEVTRLDVSQFPQ